MTEDELHQRIGSADLLGQLDIQTLVLDIVRKMPESEWLAIFHKKLPDLTWEQLEDYLYMKRL